MQIKFEEQLVDLIASPLAYFLQDSVEGALYNLMIENRLLKGPLVFLLLVLIISPELLSMKEYEGLPNFLSKR